MHINHSFWGLGFVSSESRARSWIAYYERCGLEVYPSISTWWNFYVGPGFTDIIWSALFEWEWWVPDYVPLNCGIGMKSRVRFGLVERRNRWYLVNVDSLNDLRVVSMSILWEEGGERWIRGWRCSLILLVMGFWWCVGRWVNLAGRLVLISWYVYLGENHALW